MEEKEVQEQDTQKQDTQKQDTQRLIVRLKKPFMFEKKEYSEVDLSGLEHITGFDMINIEKKLHDSGIGSYDPELTAMGAFLYAACATGLPVEFFYQLPVMEARKVKVKVLVFLLGR